MKTFLLTPAEDRLRAVGLVVSVLQAQFDVAGVDDNVVLGCQHAY